jgi:hypothetical protein
MDWVTIAVVAEGELPSASFPNAAHIPAGGRKRRPIHTESALEGVSVASDRINSDALLRSSCDGNE